VVPETGGYRPHYQRPGAQNPVPGQTTRSSAKFSDIEKITVERSRSLIDIRSSGCTVFFVPCDHVEVPGSYSSLGRALVRLWVP